jgi:lantibiotic biosynthesis protein
VTGLVAHAAQTAVESAMRCARPGLGGTAPPQAASLGAAILAARAAASVPQLADAAVVHLQLAMAARRGGTNNLFEGTAGTVSAALVADAMTGDSRLARIVVPGTAWLSERVHAIARRYRTRRERGEHGMPVKEYDAISGLAGLGRVLVLAHQRGYDHAESGVQVALEVLTDLLQPAEARLPGWWLPSQGRYHFGPDDPSGTARTGMAHGVAGPVAFLATALSAGYSVPGQVDALGTGAEWLSEWHPQDSLTWPIALTGDQLLARQRPTDAVIRRQWCIGAAGIARALHLAGRALQDPTLGRYGIAALTALSNTEPGGWGVRGSVLCCGYAGVLRTALCMLDDHSDDDLKAVADSAAQAVLAAALAETTLDADTDRMNLLYGTSGVALALYDYAHPGPTPWPALLLLT